MQLRNEEGRIDANGVTHWFRIAGAEHSTTPLVVIHGGPGGNVYNFERTIGLQLEAFATLVYYEQRGCGRSSPPPKPTDYSIPLLVSDLELLRQQLGLDRVIPLGFSFGGELALEYTLAYPQHVGRLIVQAPSIGWTERLACVQLYGFRTVARGAMSDQVGEILADPAPAVERLNRVWEIVDTETVDRLLFQKSEVARMNRTLWDEAGLVNTGHMHQALMAQQGARVPLFDRIQAIRVPTLVMVGLHDRNVGVEICRDVATLIPQGRLVVFEQSAHFPDMEETEEYAQTVQQFLLAAGACEESGTGYSR
jgi:proline iminopeptidase